MERKINLSFFFKSITLRNSLLVYLGTITNAGLTFVASVLMARLLEPTGYGLFATAVAILFLVNELTDLGINPSIIRYAAMYLQQNEPAKAAVSFRFALRSRLIFTALFVGGGLLLSPFIATILFKQADATRLIQLALLGVIPLMLQSYFSAIFQSQQRFGAHVISALIGGFSKLLGVGLLLWFGIASPAHALIVFGLAPLVAVVYCLFQSDFSLLRNVTYDKVVVQEIKRFSIWMSLWAMFAILHGKLDQFMISGTLGALQAGYYAAAFQLASLLTYMVGALGTVLNPRLSAQTPDALRKSYRYFPVAAFGFLVVVLIIGVAGNVLIPYAFGIEYKEALPVFNALLPGTFFFGIASLPNSVLNALKKPFVFSITSALALVLTFGLNLWLLPRFQAVGGAYTFTIINLIALLVSMYAVQVYLFKRPDEV